MENIKVLKPANVDKAWVALQVTEDYQHHFVKIYLEVQPGGTVTVQDPRALEAARRLVGSVVAAEEKKKRLAHLENLAEKYTIQYGPSFPIVGSVWIQGARRALSIIPKLGYTVPYLNLPAQMRSGDCFEFAVQSDSSTQLIAYVDPRNLPIECRWAHGTGAESPPRAHCREPQLSSGTNKVETLVFGHFIGDSDEDYEILVLRDVPPGCSASVSVEPLRDGEAISGKVEIMNQDIGIRSGEIKGYSGPFNIGSPYWTGISFPDGLLRNMRLPIRASYSSTVAWKIAMLGVGEAFDPAFELLQKR